MINFNVPINFNITITIITIATNIINIVNINTKLIFQLFNKIIISVIIIIIILFTFLF
jgi:hypothetical protein